MRVPTLIALSLLLLPSTSQAFSLLQGAKGAAMATAYAAAADDPSAVAANPAALVRLEGAQGYLGAAFVTIETEFTDPAGRTEETDFRLHAAPNLYLTSAAGPDVAVGFGVYSPHGVGGRLWDEEGLTRFASVESTIFTIAFHPVVAWRPLPGLSIGGGPFALYANDNEARMVDQSLLGAADGRVEFEGDGWGWGYSAGILWEPVSAVAVGLQYRSGTEVSLEGDLELSAIAPAIQPLFGGAAFTTGAEMEVDFPETFNFGVAFRPIQALTVETGATFIRWSSFDTHILRLDAQVPPAGLTDTEIVLDWEDSWAFQVGADYRLGERWSLRGGYGFLQTPIPEATLTPASPEADNHTLAAGVGYRADSWWVDAFYSPVFFEKRRVENDILSGTYEGMHHFFGVSVGYRL